MTSSEGTCPARIDLADPSRATIVPLYFAARWHLPACRAGVACDRVSHCAARRGCCDAEERSTTSTITSWPQHVCSPRSTHRRRPLRGRRRRVRRHDRFVSVLGRAISDSTPGTDEASEIGASGRARGGRLARSRTRGIGQGVGPHRARHNAALMRRVQRPPRERSRARDSGHRRGRQEARPTGTYLDAPPAPPQDMRGRARDGAARLGRAVAIKPTPLM